MSSDSDLSNSFAESNQERLKEENKFEQLSQTSEVIEQSVTESTMQDLVKTGMVIGHRSIKCSVLVFKH